MGKLETEIKIKIRNTKIQRAILGTLATAGILSVALLAPNALQMLKMFGLGEGKDRDVKRSINNSRDRLIKNGFVKYEGKYLCLTEKGKSVIGRLEKTNYKIKKPKHWDKKWRLVIFDIKEYKRETRDQIRDTLIQIGFLKLQNSVWVYPYDCEDLITLLKADFAIGREVLYIIADQIENDAIIKKYFGLKYFF
jgi:DNA-binding transcriptional regulator PaaX